LTGRAVPWFSSERSISVGITLRCAGIQVMGHTLTTLEAGVNIRF
jgi:hypothetical protein